MVRSIGSAGRRGHERTSGRKLQGRISTLWIRGWTWPTFKEQSESCDQLGCG